MGLYSYISLKGHWLAWSCSLLLTTSLVYLWSRKTPGAHLTSSKLLQLTAAIPVIGMGLVLACMLPNAYVNQSAPELRALVIPQFAWVFTLMGLGVVWLMLDKAARALQSGPQLVWVMLLLLSLTGCYALLPARKELVRLLVTSAGQCFGINVTHKSALPKPAAPPFQVIQLDHIIQVCPSYRPILTSGTTTAQRCIKVGSIAANNPVG
jgi:hypothetical protein